MAAGGVGDGDATGQITRLSRSNRSHTLLLARAKGIENAPACVKDRPVLKN